MPEPKPKRITGGGGPANYLPETYCGSTTQAQRLRAGLEELIGERDRNGNPRRVVAVRDLRELLDATEEHEAC